jgi:hypothetical protein
VDAALNFQHVFKTPAGIRIRRSGKYPEIIAKTEEELPPKLFDENKEEDDFSFYI